MLTGISTMAKRLPLTWSGDNVGYYFYFVVLCLSPSDLLKLLTVVHNTRLTFLLPWQRAGFQTSPILKHGAILHNEAEVFSLSITNSNGRPMLPFDWLIHSSVILASCHRILFLCRFSAVEK